jgi:hypothetical protein
MNFSPNITGFTHTITDQYTIFLALRKYQK